MKLRSPNILHKAVYAVIIYVLSAAANPLNGTTFGKNKVQYTHFQWKYLTTEHFDVFYSQGGRRIADYVAEVAEEVYLDLSRRFNYSQAGRDPIILLTYMSHNDFKQTNVSSAEPNEATGGFTEFLKSRVVVPFEGDYEKLRHVVHHEVTHAIMLKMLYGDGFGAILSGISQTRVPLWFTEGLAEYQSRGGMDPETEMILRDAIVNDILPEVSQLDQYGYLGVYKCGQSILYWIAWRYGDEKIGEILMQIKGLGDFNHAIKAALNIDTKELSKRWRRFVKERYWPQVAGLDPPDRYARRLTNHSEQFSYVNNSPALSPNGEYIAFLSDRSDYFDVYLMNTIDGKIKRRLVRGQRSGEFEELHWLRPGITWSPDGSQIAFCAKAGDQDALYLIDVKSGDIKKQFKFNSDALFSPSWSPEGNRIALIQVLNGQSDIILADIQTGEMERITSDLWDDADPSWSLDGKNILFTSNRAIMDKSGDIDDNSTLYGYRVEEFDVFLLTLDNREIRQITHDRFVERTPQWTPSENTILYVSDRTGSYNLYLHNIVTDEITIISNLVTGVFQPSISLNVETLAFTSYYDFGYDIYILSDPLREPRRVNPTVLPIAEKLMTSRTDTSSMSISSGNYSTYVFDRLFVRTQDEEKEMTDSTDTSHRSKEKTGKYPSKEYEVKLTPDLVFLDASYSPYYQAQGAGLMMLTDVLGNHQMYISLYLNNALEYSNTYLMYQYLARRLDYGGGFYHYAYPFYGRGVDWIDRNWGLFMFASYPLNRYKRVEFGLEYKVVDRRVWHELIPGTASGARLENIVPGVGYVHDTSIWGNNTSPSNGGRWRVGGSLSPDLKGDMDKGYNFATVDLDWRKYVVFRKDYTFAFRFSSAFSEGENPQRFFLGGMNNWINARFDNPGKGIIIDMNDVYFSRFVTPMRGVGYYSQVGKRYALINYEFRFPFIKHLVFGWPLPIYMRDLRGALFTDIGAAWNQDDLDGRLLPRKWAHGYGFGLRINLGIAPIEWDVAWSEDSGGRPQYYFSLNLGF